MSSRPTRHRKTIPSSNPDSTASGASRNERPIRPSEEIQIFECYVNCDYDGDGVTEWRQIASVVLPVDVKSLSNEEWGGPLPIRIDHPRSDATSLSRPIGL